MKKRGMTILEIIVGMTIFVLVITLAVGAFVIVSRMKNLATSMRDSQEKIRVANEMLTRYAREANTIDLTSNQAVTFRYNGANPFAAGFKIENYPTSTDPLTLTYSECSTAGCDPFAGTRVDLMSGTVNLMTTSKFEKKGSIPPYFQFSLNGQIQNSSVYYGDTFSVTNSVIMEGLQ